MKRKNKNRDETEDIEFSLNSNISKELDDIYDRIETHRKFRRRAFKKLKQGKKLNLSEIFEVGH